MSLVFKVKKSLHPTVHCTLHSSVADPDPKDPYNFTGLGSRSEPSSLPSHLSALTTLSDTPPPLPNFIHTFSLIPHLSSLLLLPPSSLLTSSLLLPPTSPLIPLIPYLLLLYPKPPITRLSSLPIPKVISVLFVSIK